MKEISLEERFQEIWKEAALNLMESGTGVDADFRKDLHAAARMLREGYPASEIIKSLKKAFMKRTGEIDAKMASRYADSVLKEVNSRAMEDIKADPGRASDGLGNRLSRDRLQFKENSGPLTFGQKGTILARMMVVDKFPPAVVEEAASRNPDIGFENAADLKKAMASCKAICERYQKIEDIPLKSKVSSYADVYRQYAKEYMRDTHTPFLSPQDDEKILANLCMEIRYAVSRKLPNTDEGRKKLDDYMRLEILPGCSKAVEEASPVAAEGWRSKSEYIPCVMHGTEYFQELLKSTDEKYEKTRSLAMDFLADVDKNQEKAVRMYPETALDTYLAKELLFERQAEPFIERAIADYTRIKGRNGYIEKNFPSKTDYARAIIKGARDSYHREHSILFRKKQDIPNRPYAELKEQGILANELYIAAMQERLELYPTFRLHMSDPMTDEEIVASILKRHTDVDLDELKEAILEHSPRASILGIPYDYADAVVEHARNELAQVEKREKQVQTQTQLFRKSRGFAMTAFSENPMEDYQNCKVAIEMLQENVPEIDVKQMMKDIAPQEGIFQPEMYANQIVGSARRVIERSRNIYDYEKDPSATADIRDLYMMKARDILRKKSFPDSNMDVEVYKAMKLDGIDEDDIKMAIRSYSPSAMEAGRDEDAYCNFVKASADFMLNEEKDKLDNYVVIPRLDEECTPDQEYEFQRKKMTDYISLPFSPDFDTKLARGLLEKKMEEGKVADILDRLSPMAMDRNGEPVPDYGRSRVKEALAGMKRMVLVNEDVKEDTKVARHDDVLVKTMVRTITKSYQEEGSQ